MHFLTKLGYYPAGKITTTFVPLLEKVFSRGSDLTTTNVCQLVSLSVKQMVTPSINQSYIKTAIK